MVYHLFIKGLLAGATIAAIGGPVSILCIRQSLSKGLRTGVAIGCGAALADAFFGALAGFGFIIISDFLLAHQKFINILGGTLLLYLGIKTFFETLEEVQCQMKIEKKSFIKNMMTSFLITLANPATILFFAALSVGFRMELSNFLAAISMISGIFSGSLGLFTILASFVTILKTKITFKRLSLVNKFFGMALLFFGFFMIIKGLFF